MKVEELKQIIEKRAGVPANLLTGETIEENISQAKALIVFKKQQEQKAGQTASAREQFAAWLTTGQNKSNNDLAMEAITTIEKSIKENNRQAAGGEASGTGSGKSAKEQFAAWLNNI